MCACVYSILFDATMGSLGHTGHGMKGRWCVVSHTEATVNWPLPAPVKKGSGEVVNGYPSSDTERQLTVLIYLEAGRGGIVDGNFDGHTNTQRLNVRKRGALY